MGNTQTQSLRRILCFTLFLLGPLVPESGHSAPAWVSRYSSSSNSQDIADNIVLGPDGTVYVSGFSKVNDRWKGAIIKYSNSGQQLWAVENTNIARVNLTGPLPLTAVDPGGGVRLAGNWAAGTNEIFITSYSATGALLWERRFREHLETHPFSLGVDAFSNTVAMGWSKGSNQWNAVMMKYAPDGTLLWNRSYPLSPVYISLATLANGDILAGVGSQLEGLTILKHSAAGELLWSSEVGGGGVPWQIRVDAGGNILVATRGAVTDAFIKLNASGELLWRKPTGLTTIGEMTLDASGNLFAAGFGSLVGVYVVKVDSDGNELWRSYFGRLDSYADIPRGIAAQGSGVSVGFAVYETSVSRQGVWAAHYDESGVEVWRDSYTNAGGSVQGMVGDANQGVYVTGIGDPFPSDFQTLKFDVAAHPLRPTILSPPRDLEVVAGTNGASFTVTTANGPNTFQWRRNGVAIPDATNATLELTLDFPGAYSVIVSNSYDYVVTPEAQLTIRWAPDLSWGIFIATNQTLIVGNELLLRADVRGDGPMTFEWRKDGTLLAQTNSVLIIEGVTAADSGVYTVVARSPFGSDTNTPVFVAVIPRSAVDEWRWVRPRPQGNALTAIAFGNGRFVAVGGGGVVLNSTDGTNWAVTHLTHFLLNGVSFGNGVFVIASSSGTIYSSADGLSWTVRAPPISTDSWYYGLSFVNGRFVVNGQEIRSSVDGVAWTSHGPSPLSGRPVAFGAGRYLIPVYGYNVTSTNLSDWKAQSFGNNSYELLSAAYGNGVFVINNWHELYTSPNGTDVSNRYSVPYAVSVAFLNGRFFSVGSTIETSVDGASWTRVAEGFYSLQSIAHGNRVYVAVGLNGVVATSPDGQTWTQTLRGLADLRGIAHGNGRYVIVGEDEAWTSTDGEEWSSISPVADDPTAIAFVEGTFVVVGGEDDLLTSKDGTTWTRIPVATNDLRAVIHDGTRFIVVGERTAVFSTNGVGWTQVASSLVGSTAAIAFGNGTFVAAVVSGLRISTNGLDWAVVFDAPHLRSLAFGNGRFVGVTLDGAAAVSTGGLVWNAYPVHLGFDAESVVFANGIFVASVGEGIATSANGEDWTVHPAHDPFYSGQIFFANGALWLLGRDETIIRSAQLQPAIRARKTGTGVELLVEAYPGQTYRLERANVLGTWTDFQTFTPQTETTTFIDNNTSGSAFYRILSP